MLSSLFTVAAAQAANLGGLDNTANKIGYSNQNVWFLVGSLAKWFFGFLGLLFLVLMITSGINWMTAAGNDAQVKKSRDRITAAVIGLLVISAAYAITAFIGDFTLTF